MGAWAGAGRAWAPMWEVAGHRLSRPLPSATAKLPSACLHLGLELGFRSQGARSSAGVLAWSDRAEGVPSLCFIGIWEEPSSLLGTKERFSARGQTESSPQWPSFRDTQ